MTATSITPHAVQATGHPALLSVAGRITLQDRVCPIIAPTETPKDPHDPMEILNESCGNHSRKFGAIILGNEYQALGLLRLCSRSGIDHVLVDQDRLGVALFSRFHKRFYHSPRYASEQFWPWLVRLGEAERLYGWMLLPTDDEQVRQLGLHYPEVMERFRYLGLPWEQYQHIYDKRLAYQWCQRHGIPTPRTIVPRSRSVAADWTFPLVVKPAFKRNFYRYTKAKALLAESAGELDRILQRDLKELPIDELLYQENIPGDGRYQWSYAGLFLRGEPIAAFTACRLRQHPPDFGRASTFVLAMHEPVVEAESRRVMAALEYSGLAEVEWKRNPRDGELKFLEVNARCWGWHTLADLVVGNLPQMMHDLFSRGAVTPVCPRYGSVWVKHITDFPIVLNMFCKRQLTLSEYLQSLRGEVAVCDWSRSDVLPFVLQFLLVPYLFAKRGY